MTKLDEWWSSLRVDYKLHIASKVYHDQVNNPKEATRIWMLLDNDVKEKIHDHCTDSHGMVVNEWFDGDVYSY